MTESSHQEIFCIKYYNSCSLKESVYHLHFLGPDSLLMYVLIVWYIDWPFCRDDLEWVNKPRAQSRVAPYLRSLFWLLHLVVLWERIGAVCRILYPTCETALFPDKVAQTDKTQIYPQITWEMQWAFSFPCVSVHVSRLCAMNTYQVRFREFKCCRESSTVDLFNPNPVLSEPIPNAREHKR